MHLKPVTSVCSQALARRVEWFAPSPKTPDASGSTFPAAQRYDAALLDSDLGAGRYWTEHLGYDGELRSRRAREIDVKLYPNEHSPRPSRISRVHPAKNRLSDGANRPHYVRGRRFWDSLTRSYVED